MVRLFFYLDPLYAKLPIMPYWQHLKDLTTTDIEPFDIFMWILLYFMPIVVSLIMILCFCESGECCRGWIVPQHVNRRLSCTTIMLTLGDIVLVRLASNIIRYRCNKNNILIFRKSSLIRYNLFNYYYTQWFTY